MADVEKISVVLPSEMVAAIRRAVASGDYACDSEVVRDALYDWTLRRKLENLEIEELRRLIREGTDSGPAVDGDLVFARLRAKYAAIAL